MKLFFENVQELFAGIGEVAAELDIELVQKQDAELVVSVLESDESVLHVVRSGKMASIT